MANRERDSEREALWREVLARFRSSGLSVRAFCRQERVSEPSFYAWRRTIAQREGQKRPTFLPVVMPRGPLSLETPGISLELRDGRTLRLPESTSVERLVALIHALETPEARP
jgi:hypothetical protein